MFAWLFWRIPNMAIEELETGRGIWFGSILDGPTPGAPATDGWPITGGTGAILWLRGGGMPYTLEDCGATGGNGGPWKQSKNS